MRPRPRLELARNWHRLVVVTVDIVDDVASDVNEAEGIDPVPDPNAADGSIRADGRGKCFFDYEKCYIIL